MPQIVKLVVNKNKRKKKNRVKLQKTTKVLVKIPKKKRRMKRKRVGDNKLGQLSNIIGDPCHGPLIRAIGTGTIVERVRSTFDCHSVAGDVNGYFVWFPSYHNLGSTGAFSNAFLYTNASSSATPTNTAANPLGMVAVGTTGLSEQDPGNATVDSAIFSRAQTISACLQLDYLGALSSISGQVAIIKNLPLKAFITSDTSTVVAAPSVDTLFAFASTRERIQISGHEVIWRPSETSSILRSSGGERGYTSGAPDAVWSNGAIGSTQSVLCNLEDSVYGVAIAWKGIPNTASNFQVNMVKVMNLELGPSGNTIENDFCPAPNAGEPNLISKAVAWLDNNVDHWQTKAVNGMSHVAGRLARSYTQNIGVSTLLGGLRGRQSIMDVD